MPSNEVSGVPPIPQDVRVKSGMGEYQSPLHSNQPHHFLASMQGTQKPILPIHSREERNLFQQLVAEKVGFSSAQWETAVRMWNAYADEHKEILYKVCITSLVISPFTHENLVKIYFSGEWKSQANPKQTMTVTAKDHLPLKKALQDPSRSENAPPVTESSMRLHSTVKGFLPVDPPALSPVLQLLIFQRH